MERWEFLDKAAAHIKPFHDRFQLELLIFTNKFKEVINHAHTESNGFLLG